MFKGKVLNRSNRNGRCKFVRVSGNERSSSFQKYTLFVTWTFRSHLRKKKKKCDVFAFVVSFCFFLNKDRLGDSLVMFYASTLDNVTTAEPHRYE